MSNLLIWFTAEAQSSQRVTIFPFAAESPAKGTTQSRQRRDGKNENKKQDLSVLCLPRHSFSDGGCLCGETGSPIPIKREEAVKGILV
jgi:hypothetical protein